MPHVRRRAYDWGEWGSLSSALRQWVAEISKVMLNIGCGDRKLAGFVNIDVMPGADLRHDVTRGIPYSDSSVDLIFSEHFLEHLPQRDGLRFLRECRRVLRPGGVVRVAMPDLDDLVTRYGNADWQGDGDMFRLGFEWVDNRCEMLNIAMREWGHQWIYNEEELRRLGDLAGLVPRGRMKFGVSVVPELNELEHRAASKLIMEFRTRTAEQAERWPKVSILIPAYRAEFLRAAIESATQQKYPELEIVVCDDCPTQEVREIVERCQKGDTRIRYVRNDPPKGPLYNYAECFQRTNGEYVQFLNDDDVLGKGWIGQAAEILSQRPDVTVVTCGREHIDESDGVLRPFGAIAIARRACVIEGRSLIRFLSALGRNHIGEPSASMFRRNDVASVNPHLMSVGGMTVRGLGDYCMWATLLSKGDLAFVTSSRCKIRVHPNQWQQNEQQKSLSKGAWRVMRQHVARLGLYKGVLGRDRWPNPWLVMRGYRWKSMEDVAPWRMGLARFSHLLDFSRRIVHSAATELKRSSP